MAKEKVNKNFLDFYNPAELMVVKAAELELTTTSKTIPGTNCK